MDGFEVLRRLRATGSKAPVLVLTARDDEVDKVIGLELGADDYLTKPFGLRELMSRIKALLRRAYGDLTDAAGGRVIRHGDLVIDLERRRVQRGDRRISLTPTEFEILRHLASRPGRVYTRRELLELLRDYEALDQDEKTINVHVSHLRDKIEDDPAAPAFVHDGPRCRLRLRRTLRPAAGRSRALVRRLVPRTFQARLTIAFVGVVALTLVLVAIVVLNRLDDYFTQQQNAEVTARAKLVAAFVDSRVGIAARGPAGGRRRRQRQPARRRRRSESRSRRFIANFIAQADVDVNALGADDGGEGRGIVPVQGGHFAAGVTVPPPTGTRELFQSQVVPYHSTGSIDSYIIGVSLSNPYTFRQTTLANVTSLPRGRRRRGTRASR